MSKIRQQRTADRIQTMLSELFIKEMRDPRLQHLTITDVSIDRELQHANIYINAFGDDSRQDEVMRAIEKATGFMRRAIAKRIRLRTVPQLHFHWDPSLANAQEIDDILSSIDIPPADLDEAEH